MRVMDWLTGWFKRRKPAVENLSIEIDSIGEKFHLVKEARRMAKLGLPAFHEKKPTRLELDVVEHLNQLRDAAQREYLRRTDEINAKVLHHELSHQSMQLDVLNAEFERQTRKLMDEQGAWLKKLAYNAMTRFKVLVFLVVIEGVLNANFFAEGLSSGLIGGFVYAALLAAINVVGCFFLGKYALPWLISKPIAGKVFGVVSLIFTACFMVMVAMSIGHIREQLMAGSASPTKDAWAVMQTQFLGLNDLVSWFLVAMSLGFAIASVFDGLTIDDIYPGYGAVVRRCNSTRDEFESEFEEIREELEDLKQDKLDLINQSFKNLHELIASLRKLVMQKEALQREFADQLTQSEVVLYAVLRKFRMENEIARDDGLRPGYFDSLPSLDPVNMPRMSTDAEQTLISKIEQDIRAYENTVKDQREKVYNLYEQCISRLNHLKYH